MIANPRRGAGGHLGWRIVRTWPGVLFALIGVLIAGGAQASEAPRVLVLSTGGTIGSAPGGRQLDGQQLVGAIPELKGVARVTVEDLAARGSSALTLADEARLVARIRQAFAADPDLAGVVVTHGTDTMEETAFLLDLVIADPRPVVITGSMRQSTVSSADGPGNMLEAVTVAAAPASRHRGVLVVLDDQIHAAHAVSKTNTTRLSTFASLDEGPVGMISSATGLRYFRAPGRLGRPYVITPEKIADLPRVDIVYSYLGGDDALAKAAISAGAKGLVIAGFGSGTMTPSMTAAALALATAGMPVVLSTRVASGPIHDPSNGAGTLPAAFARSGFLNPAKARILLMLHIAAGDGETLSQAFSPY
jgi:L-asparaginase